MTVPGVSKILEWDLLVTVIDRSMTVLKYLNHQCYKEGLFDRYNLQDIQRPEGQ